MARRSMSTRQLNEVPVFKPTMDEFAGFEAFCCRDDVWQAGMDYGIVKVQPPQEWLDMQKSHDLSNIDPSVLDTTIPTPAKQLPNGRKGIYE
jgi:hypothetical protein